MNSGHRKERLSYYLKNFFELFFINIVKLGHRKRDIDAVNFYWITESLIQSTHNIIVVLKVLYMMSIYTKTYKYSN